MVDPSEKSEPTWGVDKRLTPALAKRGFTAVPTTFLEHYSALGVSSAEAMVIVHLLSYKWGKKSPYPRLSVLAQKMGISSTSVRAHTRKLEDKKLLKRIARAGHSNAFDLSPLFKKLEELIAAEPEKIVPKTNRRPGEKKS